MPCPVLILHGRRDRLIPFQLGMELYQAARLSRCVGVVLLVLVRVRCVFNRGCPNNQFSTNHPCQKSTYRIRHAPHLLEDVWFSEVPEGAHSDLYAHAQWTHDVHSFMAAMEAAAAAATG